MNFNEGDIVVIKNINGIWDINWYTKDGAEYTELNLTIGESVKIATNKYNIYRPYHLVKDNLVSQDFTKKEMESIFV